MLQMLFSNQKKTSDYTVLVVEDDQPIRETIIENLREEGYLGVSAMNGEDALKVLDSIPMPSAFIVDLIMPEMSGDEFVARARVRFGRTGLPPVLLLTAARHGESTANVIEVEDYMPKPFDIGELLENVLSLIGKNNSRAHV